jgi:hypothetical protein
MMKLKGFGRKRWWPNQGKIQESASRDSKENYEKPYS